MEILKIVDLVFVLIIVAVLVIATTKPNTFRYQRTQLIKAPAEKILAQINDFHLWTAWSPYEKLDPNMKRTYSGAQSGVGAIYGWAGNGKAGVGSMEITESTPSQITIKLDFTKPLACNNIAEFTIEPEGESCKVTWAMHGQSKYISKVFSVFCNMDKMVGESFEIGLINLKDVVETKTPTAVTAPV